MKKSIFIAAFLFAFQIVDAQTNDFKWRFGVNAGITQYRGDLNTGADINSFEEYKDYKKDNEDFLKDQTRYMYGLEVERRISQRIGLRLGANVGKVAHSDRFIGNEEFERSLNFQTDIVDANAALKLSIFKRKSFFNLYLLGGVGITAFNVYGDLVDENENYYNYSFNNVELDEDYETNLSDLDLQRDYKQVVMHIPLGVGARLKILPRITASIEFESRFLFSDYLDNVSDAGAGRTLTEPLDQVAYNPNVAYQNELRGNADDKLYDSYHVLRVGLSYNFGRMKNAESSSSSKSRKSVGSRVKNAGKKVKNAIPTRKGKFRAPVFYPSSTPSSIHTAEDVLIGEEREIAEAQEAIVNAAAEGFDETVITTNENAEVSEETMLLIDETLAVVDETILVIDETVAEQEAIEIEILSLEEQIAELEAGLANDSSTSDAELVSEIERLETEVEQAIAEQEAYRLEMEKAQLEALEMLEAANKEIEAAQEEIIEEKVEEAIEEVIEEDEKEEKKSKKKRRRNKNKDKNNDKEDSASNEDIEIEVKVNTMESDSVQVWIEEGKEGSYKIEKKVIVIDGEEGMGHHKGGGKGMRHEMHQMQMEIDRLQAEKNEMQMDQIQRELQDIKNTLNLLLRERIEGADNGSFNSGSSKSCNAECAKACCTDKQSCDTKCKKDCCKGTDAKSCSAECAKACCSDKKSCDTKCKKDCCKGTDAKSCAPGCTKECCKGTGSIDTNELEKLMQENQTLNQELRQAITEAEKKNVVSNNANNSATTYPTNTNTTGSTYSGTSGSSSTSQQPSTTTGSSSYNFPKSSTGRTKYDYTQMEQVGTYDVNYTASSFNANDPKIKETLQSVANQVNSLGGVVLIKANTTEYEKTKMSNVVFDINKEFVYNYGLSPQQIDSSIHIAADGVRNVREIYINNNRIELLIFR